MKLNKKMEKSKMNKKMKKKLKISKMRLLNLKNPLIVIVMNNNMIPTEKLKLNYPHMNN